MESVWASPFTLCQRLVSGYRCQYLMDCAGATPQLWQDDCDFIGRPVAAESSQGAIHQPQLMEGERTMSLLWGQGGSGWVSSSTHSG